MQRILSLLLLSVFLISKPGLLDTMSIHSGFSFGQLNSYFDRYKFIENINITKTDEEYRGPCGIRTYDVNSTNQIAVGFNPINPYNQRINLYDKNGVFQCGYKFTYSGDYQLEYDLTDNNLQIHLNKSGLLIKIDENGQVTDIVIAHDSQDNFKYMIILDMQTIITRNGFEYGRGSIVPSSFLGYRLHFTTITMKTPSNITLQIYNNTFSHWFTIIIGPLIILFIAGTLIIINIVRRNALTDSDI